MVPISTLVYPHPNGLTIQGEIINHLQIAGHSHGATVTRIEPEHKPLIDRDWGKADIIDQGNREGLIESLPIGIDRSNTDQVTGSIVFVVKDHGSAQTTFFIHVE